MDSFTNYDTQFDNPFYDNHIFNKRDLNRVTAKFRDKLRFIFSPTLVQISEGYAVHFKINSWGEYLIIKFEKLTDLVDLINPSTKKG